MNNKIINFYKKIMVLVIVCCFTGVSIIPSISGYSSISKKNSELSFQGVERTKVDWLLYFFLIKK